jgi:hypothetical protein
MPNDQRVVIRSSWPATFAITAPIALIFTAAQFLSGTIGTTVTVLVVITAVTAGSRLLNHVELTPHGLGIHWFSMTVVPWQQIRSVEMVNRYGGCELYVFDVVANRRRRLAAPRGSFGVGTQQAAGARDLIEQWWLAYSGLPVPTAPVPTSPPEPPGGPNDPYRPPPEG